MKRYEQGSVGMRPDPEGLWCDYTEAQAEIERLRTLLRDARDDVAACMGQEVKPRRIEAYKAQLAAIDKAIDEVDDE